MKFLLDRLSLDRSSETQTSSPAIPCRIQLKHAEGSLSYAFQLHIYTHAAADIDLTRIPRSLLERHTTAFHDSTASMWDARLRNEDGTTRSRCLFRTVVPHCRQDRAPRGSHGEIQRIGPAGKQVDACDPPRERGRVEERGEPCDILVTGECGQSVFTTNL